MSTHVSAAEAARMYGLSDKTVRRWIKAGKLRADIRDGAYLVAPDEVSALASRVSAHTSVPTSAPGTDMPAEDVRPSKPAGADTFSSGNNDPLLTIIRELKAELLQTTAVAAMWQERARVLSDQLALAAPQSPPEAPRSTMSPDLISQASLARLRAL